MVDEKYNKNDDLLFDEKKPTFPAKKQFCVEHNIIH